MTEVLYFMDSFSALCWVLNTTRSACPQILRWTVRGEECYKLFHESSRTNAADILMKPCKLTMADFDESLLW